MDGFLLIDKPAGITSADVVRAVKRRLRTKTGHLGTLDPFATGILPLCLGEATKLAQFLNLADKSYEGTIRLGTATDTGDRTGNVVAEAPVPALSGEALDRLSAAFAGDRQQTPPMYSAVKRAGVPLYKLARQGLEVEREPRQIRIHMLRLTVAGPDTLNLCVKCSKGTYVRVLAEEIATALGTVGHLESLRRTSFGSLDIARAIPLGALEAEKIPILTMREVLEAREFILRAEEVRRVRQGFAPLLERLPPGDTGEQAKLIGPAGELIAVIRMADRWEYVRVLSDWTVRDTSRG